MEQVLHLRSSRRIIALLFHPFPHHCIFYYSRILPLWKAKEKSITSSSFFYEKTIYQAQQTPETKVLHPFRNKLSFSFNPFILCRRHHPQCCNHLPHHPVSHHCLSSFITP